MTAVDRDRLAELLDAERQRFADNHPKSRALFERTGGSLMGGVPMPWMTRWASPFPVFVESAQDARLHDVDGHDYLDLSLGDTGALFGHSAEPIANAIAEQAARGITFMLPTADAAAVGEALAARFGLPFWHSPRRRPTPTVSRSRWCARQPGGDRRLRRLLPRPVVAGQVEPSRKAVLTTG